MSQFTVNGQARTWEGPVWMSLLSYLRLHEHITSPKDGCSGEGVCGACTVEVNGRPRLACCMMMGSLDGAVVVTTEGIPAGLRRLLGQMFAEKGAVQCGFCSPGFIMRVKSLFGTGRRPSRPEIIRHIKPNICRCTGYVKIVDAIEAALDKASDPVFFRGMGDPEPQGVSIALIGSSWPKYQSFETALGMRPFVDDLRVDGMLHGVLRFADHPRARLTDIDLSEAALQPDVIRIFTAADIPGNRHIGLIHKDWPLMVAAGETNNCTGDVIALVVASTEAAARQAAAMIKIDYEVLMPVTEARTAALPASARVHDGRSNVLENCGIRFGDVDKAFNEAAYVSSGIYETQRIEHAFLETETALAMPEGVGLLLYSQGQGVYVDRRQVAAILDLPQEKVRVVQVQNGGGFGGKEDLTVQGHAALAAFLLQKAVRVHLNRAESLRMHPKRHPVWMEISLAADKKGKFTALRLKAVGDTGAYASVGTKVMERVVGHATGAYTVAAVDIEALTVYTNNIPSGAMRGFGVPQITFAVEGCIDDICRQGGFDRWQIRYDNALVDGARTATGQQLQGVGLKKTLLAVKDAFQNARFAGIACGLKNTGVGNGMTDNSEVIIEVVSGNKVRLHHGWTEMGQGVHTMAVQTLHQETGIDPSAIEVVVDTAAGIPTGMTTSSRATALVGNAIIDAAKRLRADLEAAEPSHEEKNMEELRAKEYPDAGKEQQDGEQLHADIKQQMNGTQQPDGKQQSVKEQQAIGNRRCQEESAGSEVAAVNPKLARLAGRNYKGKYVCDWTCKPGADVDDPKIHFAYGYATQVVVLDDEGRVSRVIAAHDAGKIMNRMLFEGQIEGAVHMGLGYALTEDLPMKDGRLVSDRFRDLGVLRADAMPEIEVIGVEVADQYGPYGAKGIGEIGMVPTAAAMVNALTAYDGKRRFRLPVLRA